MKQNMDKMEQDMHVLSDRMKKIDGLCGEIDSTMASRREKIDELSGVYKLLKGRQFLFELPNRLRHDLTHGQYADAVKYYLLTESVLRSYEHLPSFGGINQECKATMAELKEKLWERVKNPSTSPSSFAVVIGASGWLCRWPHQRWSEPRVQNGPISEEDELKSQIPRAPTSEERAGGPRARAAWALGYIR